MFVCVRVLLAFACVVGARVSCWRSRVVLAFVCRVCVRLLLAFACRVRICVSCWRLCVVCVRVFFTFLRCSRPCVVGVCVWLFAYVCCSCFCVVDGNCYFGIINLLAVTLILMKYNNTKSLSDKFSTKIQIS